MRRVERTAVAAAIVLMAGCAGSSIEAFPVPTHRPQEVQMQGARLNEAVSEFISIEGLDLVRGRAITGIRITDWSEVFRIEEGAPPMAECPAASDTESVPQYRARYRFEVSNRTGIQSLHVVAHWQVARGEALAGETNWLECRSTGAFERTTQDQIVTRARMMSRGIGQP